MKFLCLIPNLMMGFLLGDASSASPYAIDQFGFENVISLRPPYLGGIQELDKRWVFQTMYLNPILTGGGGGSIWPPPCTKSLTAVRPPQIATRLFMSFFFQVLRIFWYQVCENRTIGREVTQRFVLARRLKICPKPAFCIRLCTKHVEITDFLKML